MTSLFDLYINDPTRNYEETKYTVYAYQTMDTDNIIHRNNLLCINIEPKLDISDPDIKNLANLLSRKIEDKLNPMLYTFIPSGQFDVHVKHAIEGIEDELQDLFLDSTACCRLRARIGKDRPIPRCDNPVKMMLYDKTGISSIL